MPRRGTPPGIGHAVRAGGIDDPRLGSLSQRDRLDRVRRMRDPLKCLVSLVKATDITAALRRLGVVGMPDGAHPADRVAGRLPLDLDIMNPGKTVPR